MRVWYGKGTVSNSLWLEGRVYPGNYGRKSRKTGKIQGRNVWYSTPENLSFLLKEKKLLSNFKEGNNRITFVSFYGDWNGERVWQLAMAGMHAK